MENIFDLERYPIADSDHPLTIDLINKTKEELESIGCAVIPGFIKPESLLRMNAEVEKKLGGIHWTSERNNPYFTKDDPELPEDHPKRFFEERKSGYITSDNLDPDSDLHTIFQSLELREFLRRVLGLEQLFCFADPIAKHPYSIMKEGHYFPWHFDGNEFTVSILIQEAEEGGLFEFVPDIRKPGDENLDSVKSILKGSRDRVRSLKLKPGDMQLFKGRYSLHRVTRVRGKINRIIALPSYTLHPGMMNRPEHSIQVYGKSLPIQYERENVRSDNLID